MFLILGKIFIESLIQWVPAFYFSPSSPPLTMTHRKIISLSLHANRLQEIGSTYQIWNLTSGCHYRLHTTLFSFHPLLCISSSNARQHMLAESVSPSHLFKKCNGCYCLRSVFWEIFASKPDEIELYGESSTWTTLCHLCPIGICLMCQGPNVLPLSRKSKENRFQLFSVKEICPHPVPPTSIPTLIECVLIISHLLCFFSNHFKSFAFLFHGCPTFQRV